MPTLVTLVREAISLSTEILDMVAEAEAEAARIVFRQATRDYSTVRREHHDSIYAAVVGYLDTNLPVTQYRNLAGRAIIEHYPEAFYAGYGEASGDDTVDPEDDRWLTEQISAGIGFVDTLFASLRDTRKAGGYDADAIAQSTADNYTLTLDSILGQGRMRGDLNKPLTFDGDDGEESCDQCQKYKGQRHRAKTWLKHDLVRRNGNENFDCGRWPACHHNLLTDDGEIWSV